MTKILEKLSLIGLSFMLVTSYSISSALPEMMRFFSDKSESQVDLLVSIPSLLMAVTLAFNPFIKRVLSDTQMVVSGLLIVSIAGIVPFINHQYTVILMTRMFFGIGLGIINALAISIISEHYDGHERVQMLGLRGSTEVVGASVTMFLVGLLIHIDWYWAFLVYALGFVMLALYLLFAPKERASQADTEVAPSTRLSYSEIGQSILMGLVCAWVICINSSISLRLPGILKDQAIAPSITAAILSIQNLLGIVTGVTFAFLVTIFKRRLLVVAIVALGVMLLGMSVAPTIWMIAVCAIATGFCYSLALTTIFNHMSEVFSIRVLNTATAMVLIFCNLGSALSPYSLKVMALFGVEGLPIFRVFGIGSILLACLVSLYQHLTPKREVPCD